MSNPTRLAQARACLAPLSPLGSTSKIAGYQTARGRQLALNLQNATDYLHVFSEPVLGLAPAAIARLHKRSYAGPESRNHHLAANAPKLAAGRPADLWRIPTVADFKTFLNWYNAL